MSDSFDATKIQAWVHNLDPFLIRFSENSGIRWYGLAYIAGFVVGALIMRFLAKRGRRTLPADDVVDFITYVVLGTMLGGRLGYALFYDTSLLTSWNAHLTVFGHTFQVWNLLAVWEGGMASHGGIVGIILACGIYSKRFGVSWLHLGDLTTLGGSLGIFFGRIANFINGELMGRPVHSAIPWAVKFPQDMYRWGGQGPTALGKLTAVVREVGIQPETWMSWITQLRTSNEARDHVDATVEQIIVGIQNGNQKLVELMQPLLEARHPSQLYQGLMEGLLVFIVCFLTWYKPRKPGFIGGLFLTMYAIMRILGEEFREPDAQIGYQIFGLTRGQILSIVMLVGSVILWILVSRRNVPVISGWGPEAQRLKREEP